MEQPDIISVRDFEEHRTASEYAEAIAKEKIANGSKLRLPLPVGMMARMERLYDLISMCGDTARDHGFWEAHVDKALKVLGLERKVYDAFRKQAEGKEINQAESELIGGVSEKMAGKYLAISALSEAELLGDPTIFLALILTEGAEAIEAVRTDNWTKPSGVWEELADVVIRLFDFIARYGPKHEMPPSRFVAMIQAKMAVNEARPPKHGKNF